MSALSISNPGTATRAARVIPVLFLLAAIMLAIPNPGRADRLPPFGFHPDAGDRYFVPSDRVYAVEQLDSLDPNSEFGFFYQGNPATLIPLIDGLDGCCGQAVEIDFLSGLILDIDTPAEPPTAFSVMPDNIGFYLTIGGALTLYSDPALNTAVGGADLFHAFESIANPMQWALYFQADRNGDGPPLDDIALDIVFPIASVPLPPTVYMVGSLLPILLVISRRRRKNAVG